MGEDTFGCLSQEALSVQERCLVWKAKAKVDGKRQSGLITQIGAPELKKRICLWLYHYHPKRKLKQTDNRIQNNTKDKDLFAIHAIPVTIFQGRGS
jgi:hypothetical protein